MTKPRDQLASRLRQLSKDMLEIAVDMDYFGGMAEWAKHGAELAGAAHIARTWADEIDEQKEKK
ncbi:MAG: hypothetical protein E6Q97_12605 [Desulfurellales bacterium]|nr:MAG: hypothetical protein E6Q97_12605 [Desulfurellales bacterium]